MPIIAEPSMAGPFAPLFSNKKLFISEDYCMCFGKYVWAMLDSILMNFFSPTRASQLLTALDFHVRQNSIQQLMVTQTTNLIHLAWQLRKRSVATAQESVSSFPNSHHFKHSTCLNTDRAKLNSFWLQFFNIRDQIAFEETEFYLQTWFIIQIIRDSCQSLY